MLKPNGWTNHSFAPVATQVRPMLPVFCGISGSCRTTWKVGSYFTLSEYQLAGRTSSGSYDIKRGQPFWGLAIIEARFVGRWYSLTFRLWSATCDTIAREFGTKDVWLESW